jgi:hypothetical protein
MFRRWPFFQRLLSWTKPYAPVERGTRAYERFDWNSLLAEEPENRALMTGLMDGTSYFPSRTEMELNLVAFAERTGIEVRYGCAWQSTRRETTADGERFVLETTDGQYRARIVVFAVGVAEPYVPPTPGLDLVPHYSETRPAETYADKRIFIVGKQNSGFELASGLLPWARSIVLASPSPAKLSVVTRSLVGIRARYLQPFEDHVLAGGVAVLEASIDRIERTGATFGVTVRPSAGGEPVTWRRCEICPHSASRLSGRAGCRPRRLSGRAPRHRESTSPARSARAPPGCANTACRPTPARSTVPVTTLGCWPDTSPKSTSASFRTGRLWPKTKSCRS